ncbi:hypothetical protein E2562_006436 [Oryza meyeriana var. granulata]|uniref:Uncharacterized protein n=1 Tax=Oryza meyeriana var. granulata TaxID=110450 RepID=A0A6G1CNR6_9ORYZ|nr:hypothetical protein E2562_006436 [Oryza meyeriana var. granulata]
MGKLPRGCVLCLDVDDCYQCLDHEWADVPVYGETAAGLGRVEELEEEYYMERGVDPDRDEPTGADEEWSKRSAAKSSSSPGVVTRSKAQCSTSSPGAVTRSKAQSSTRQRAAGQNGSPTGTKRRLVA